jgi:hypothetical protein
MPYRAQRFGSPAAKAPARTAPLRRAAQNTRVVIGEYAYRPMLGSTCPRDAGPQAAAHKTQGRDHRAHNT